MSLPATHHAGLRGKPFTASPVPCSGTGRSSPCRQRSWGRAVVSHTAGASTADAAALQDPLLLRVARGEGARRSGGWECWVLPPAPRAVLVPCFEPQRPGQTLHCPRPRGRLQRARGRRCGSCAKPAATWLAFGSEHAGLTELGGVVDGDWGVGEGEGGRRRIPPPRCGRPRQRHPTAASPAAPVGVRHDLGAADRNPVLLAAQVL